MSSRRSQLAYPVALQEHQDAVLVSFPDVPEALTEGVTRHEALEEAHDCLVAALGGYVQDGRDVPAPSPPDGRPVVELPATIALKLALYEAMREHNVGDRHLAECLGVITNAVRRLLDLDQPSDINEIDEAFDALKRHSVIEVPTTA